MTVTYTKDGWNVQVTKTDKGCIYEYQQLVTLTGAAQNIDLAIHFPFELNRIEWFSNDATAKSFTERIYSGRDQTSYDQILAVALDTNLPIAYYPTGSEGSYTMQPLIIRTAVSASTAAKTLNKKIIIRRLGYSGSS